MYDWLIVGAGFSGSVLAERIASERGESVLVIDRRPHIAGNAYDHTDAAGVLIHHYDPHIFHTNSEKIFRYLSKFTDWRFYEHRVLAEVDGKLLPFPINIDTLNDLYGLDLSENTVADFLAQRAEVRDEIRNSEDHVVSKIGRELFEKFFAGYTRKQWGVEASQLDKSVAARIPVRFDRDDRFFTDDYQFMPSRGYTALFARMLRNPKITVKLSADYREVVPQVSYRRLIFTGAIDEYFGYRLGRLPYRSLRFEHRTIEKEWFQPVGQVNYPQDHDYTRVSEFKHITGQEADVTSIAYEYPTAVGDPYYPVPHETNRKLYNRYRELAQAEKNVWFAGRLASYQYLNMDQVVGQALATFEDIQMQLSTETVAG